eukprot:1267519-Alexandrium_andersonii.AAC.1
MGVPPDSTPPCSSLRWPTKDLSKHSKDDCLTISSTGTTAYKNRASHASPCTIDDLILHRARWQDPTTRTAKGNTSFGRRCAQANVQTDRPTLGLGHNEAQQAQADAGPLSYG